MVTSSKFHSETSIKVYMYIFSIRRAVFIVALEKTAYCLSLTLKLKLSTALSTTTDVLEVFENTRREVETEFGSIFEDARKVFEDIKIDNLISQLKCRFSRDLLALPLQSIIPDYREMHTNDDDIIKASVKHEHFSDGSSLRLKSESKLWRKMWDICFFPNIAILLQIFGTIPVTTSTYSRNKLLKFKAAEDVLKEHNEPDSDEWISAGQHSQRTGHQC
ncbi:hypothetical protein PR048_017137 [Dryococelus australis]|uniref:HAT C-terminal dimerisation domain-containing protein n=1 Tax=Dryococelus australis TaxID=614101 RepID=A0ABQ9H8N2_9NEOP|nr:hypothetical protein PR048_017137 [Dryococelus australis]